MNSRAAAMRPGHGNLLHAESEFAGEKKNFGIESPALDFLQRENFLYRLLLKSFVAALRILETKAESNSQQQIKNTAEELAMEGLALGLGFGLQPARSDGDVGAVIQRFEKFGKFLDRRREVASLKTTTLPRACNMPLRTL